MKRNGKIKCFIGNFLVAACLITSSMICHAGTYEVPIYILPNQVWSGDYEHTDSHDPKNEYVYARNHTVYPESGKDNFSRIQVQVTNGFDLLISDVVILNEADSDMTSIRLYDRWSDTTFVGFEFRGNSDKEAYAIVSYDGN